MSANKDLDKREILNVRLTRLEGETPDTIRVVGQAREVLERYSRSDMPGDVSGEGENTNSAESVAEENNGEPSAALPKFMIEEAVPLKKPPFRIEGSSPAKQRRGGGFKPVIDRAANALSGIIPKRGDPPLEILRKCIFNIALITLIVSLAYIVNEMIIIPQKNQQGYNSLAELYDPDNPAPPPADFPPERYPQGILPAFKALYAQNDQIRGWLQYKDANKKWLNINYPVMYSGDNEFYLYRDFQKARNKNGALFFDERNNLGTPNDTNRVLIIYGHNMASGQMLSPLNKFLNNLSYMRSAPVINLDTLFERRQYKVFAVMLLSTRKEDGPYFDYIRTSFASDDDFMDFVANIRARSVYDFNSVDINPDDQLLVLSTCTATSNAKFKDGRCVVVARRVRNGETVAVRPSDIVKNEDVIMPYAWYVNQKKTPHRYYTDSDYTIPGATYTTRRPTYFPTTRQLMADHLRRNKAGRAHRPPVAPPRADYRPLGGTTTADGTTAPPVAPPPPTDYRSAGWHHHRRRTTARRVAPPPRAGLRPPVAPPPPTDYRSAGGTTTAARPSRPAFRPDHHNRLTPSRLTPNRLTPNRRILNRRIPSRKKPSRPARSLPTSREKTDWKGMDKCTLTKPHPRAR